MKARLAIAVSLLLPTSFLLAQQPSPGSAPPPPPGQPSAQAHHQWAQGGPVMMQPIGPSGPERGFDGPGRLYRPGGMHRASFDRGPRGDWWKNPELASRIGLTPDQAKRLDDLQMQSRLQDIQMRATLEADQVRLQPLLSNANFDEHAAEALLDKIADERAAMEKAQARSMLSMRAVLTPEQRTRLQADRRGMGPGARRFGGPQGPGAGKQNFGPGTMHPNTPPGE